MVIADLERTAEKITLNSARNSSTMVFSKLVIKVVMENVISCTPMLAETR